jgi:hypothetical protein
MGDRSCYYSMLFLFLSLNCRILFVYYLYIFAYLHVLDIHSRMGSGIVGQVWGGVRHVYGMCGAGQNSRKGKKQGRVKHAPVFI